MSAVQYEKKKFILRSTLLDIPFWLGILYWSFVPATKSPWLHIGSIYIDSRDAVVIAVAFIYLIIFPIIRKSIKWKSWHYRIPQMFFWIIIYAFISIFWSGLDSRNAFAMGYTLVLALSAFFIGYVLILNRSGQAIRTLLWKVCVFLAIVGLVYTIESYFRIGLRSYYRDVVFGIDRVKGPLFASSTGALILIPAFAFALGEFLYYPDRKLLKIGVIFSLITAIIGLGSRSALIALLIFIFLSIILMRGLKKKFIFIISIAIVLVLSITIIFSKANINRLNFRIENSRRYVTYYTSLEIIEHRDPFINIIGSGYGSQWPWYLIEVDYEGKVSDKGLHFISTQYGKLLYQPHSLFLMLITELGIFGLLFFFYFLKVFWSLIIRSQKNKKLSIFISGMVASGAMMFSDLILFKLGRTNVLWWIFLFGTFALIRKQNSINFFNNKDLVRGSSGSHENTF